MHAAAATVPELGTRVLLTTGHEDLAAFAGVGEAWFLVRCITSPPGPLPPRHALLLERGPFTLEGELALIDEHAIDLVVTKDSGGASGESKLAAARARGIPVLLVRRPALPEAAAADCVAGARRWVHATLGA